MQDNKSITVVIATLGGESLGSTVDTLNSGSLVPAEILICIPEQEAELARTLKSGNISVVSTGCRGQVAQRAIGFQRAKNALVMQLDDDMSVDQFCLERLAEASHKFGPNVAVAPALIDQHTGQSVYAKPKRSRFLQAIYFWLMNGAKGYVPGRIDKSGSAVGVDPATAQSRFVDVQWLAGGCVLHHKENLVLENFWQRAGKAYCEDVVHSHLLHQRGVRLIVDTAAHCELEVVRQSAFKFNAFVPDLYRDYLARKYYMKRLSISSSRIYLYYFIRFASYLWSRLR
jgi:hypothetical protein